MAKIRNPLQFSRHFGIPESKLAAAGILDPTLNVDVKLFIDPLLLSQSAHPEMRAAENTYKSFFSLIIKLLEAAKDENDIAWRTVYRRLRFKEIKGTCLGYGAASIHGSGFGPSLTRKVAKTAKEIVNLGVKDPDLFIALPLLEEDVGPDLISDMTTNIILPDLIRFNHRILDELKIPRERFSFNGIDSELPRNPTVSRATPVILVPVDVLRELPLANDWDEVCRIAAENSVLRDKVNRLIGEIWRAKTKKDKREIRSKVLQSYEAFNVLLDTIHAAHPRPYDIEDDPEGVLIWRKIHETVATQFPLHFALKTQSAGEVYKTAQKIVGQFKYLIEDRGLWKELWHNGKRRNEKSVQRIFFAVADSYCRANDVDINPEIDTGSGQIDFKFSKGYDARVLVEVKLSDNTKLIGGYQKQLEAYKKAENTTKAIYVVIDVGGMGKRDEQLTKIRNDQLSKGLPGSDIVFIDGLRKPSASKL